MPTPLVDTRPGGLDGRFRTGEDVTFTLTFPAGYTTGKTFAASLNGTALTSANGSVTVVGDVVTVVAAAAFTGTLADSGSFPFELTVDGAVKLIGDWQSSDAAAGQGHTQAQVTVDGLTVQVAVG